MIQSLDEKSAFWAFGIQKTKQESVCVGMLIQMSSVPTSLKSLSSVPGLSYFLLEFYCKRKFKSTVCHHVHSGKKGSYSKIDMRYSFINLFVKSYKLPLPFRGYEGKILAYSYILQSFKPFRGYSKWH